MGFTFYRQDYDIDAVPSHLPRETRQWLQETGLLDALRKGRLVCEEAA